MTCKEIQLDGKTLHSIEFCQSELKYSISHLRYLARSGKIGAVKLGNRYWFDLEKLIANLKREPAVCHKSVNPLD